MSLIQGYSDIICRGPGWSQQPPTPLPVVSSVMVRGHTDETIDTEEEYGEK